VPSRRAAAQAGRRVDLREPVQRVGRARSMRARARRECGWSTARPAHLLRAQLRPAGTCVARSRRVAWTRKAPVETHLRARARARI